MRSDDAEALIEQGLDPEMLDGDVRSITLNLSRVTWSVLEALSELDDLPFDILIRQILEQKAVEKLRMSMLVLAAQRRISPHKKARLGQKLYFMQRGIGGPIKIGVSTNAEKRRYTLQISNEERLDILAVVDQQGDINERALHKRFAKHRKAGEWFEPHPEVLQLIEKLRQETH